MWAVLQLFWVALRSRDSMTEFWEYIWLFHSFCNCNFLWQFAGLDLWFSVSRPTLLYFFPCMQRTDVQCKAFSLAGTTMIAHTTATSLGGWQRDLLGFDPVLFINAMSLVVIYHLWSREALADWGLICDSVNYFFLTLLFLDYCTSTA